MDEILGIKGKKKNNLLNPEIPLMTLNNDAVEETVHAECLKLRGGATGPIHLSIDYDKVGKLLTIFSIKYLGHAMKNVLCLTKISIFQSVSTVC